MKTAWRQTAPGEYIDLEWRNGDIYLEDGPDEWPKRGHEGNGGSFSIQEIRRRGTEWFSGYDGLYERLIDDLAPRFRVTDALRGVVVTLDADLVPCPSPCRFAFNGKKVYVYPATAEPSRHVAAGSSASLLIADPDDEATGATPSWWTRIHGAPQLVDDPEWELARAADLLAEKYGDAAPVEADVPTIRIDIDQWESYPGEAQVG